MGVCTIAMTEDDTCGAPAIEEWVEFDTDLGICAAHLLLHAREDEERIERELAQERNAENSRQALLNRLEAEEALARWKEDHGHI